MTDSTGPQNNAEGEVTCWGDDSDGQISDVPG